MTASTSPSPTATTPPKNSRMTLVSEEFLHRFLQHVLPRGFQRVRYFGLFSPAAKQTVLRVQALLDWPPPKPLTKPQPFVPRLSLLPQTHAPHRQLAARPPPSIDETQRPQPEPPARQKCPPACSLRFCRGATIKALGTTFPGDALHRATRLQEHLGAQKKYSLLQIKNCLSRSRSVSPRKLSKSKRQG